MRIKKRFIVSGCRNCPACMESLQRNSIVFMCMRYKKIVPYEGFFIDCGFIKVFYKKHYDSFMPKVSEAERKERASGKGKYYNQGRDKILERMKEKGIKAPELAEQLEMTKACFYRLIKTNYHNFSKNKRIKKLCEILEIDIKMTFPALAENEKIENECKNAIAHIREGENK